VVRFVYVLVTGYELPEEVQLEWPLRISRTGLTSTGCGVLTSETGVGITSFSVDACFLLGATLIPVSLSYSGMGSGLSVTKAERNSSSLNMLRSIR